MDDDIAPRPAVLFADLSWSHRDYLAESIRFANLFLALRDERRPFHVGVLLDNTPDYLFAFGGAALTGATVVGLNHTRQGEHLLRDITHTDIGWIITEPRHMRRLEPIMDDLPFGREHVLVSHRFDDDLDPHELTDGVDLGIALAAMTADDPGFEPDVSTPWALIFTSGTTDAPKAVICSQRRLLQTGARMSMIMALGRDDVGYVCMPLFHSNAVMVGWAPSIVTGCAVGLGRKFSASAWLTDVRRYGATYFNYTGKPLSYLVATPTGPAGPEGGDADNPLRVAFGNEGSPEVVDTFAKRFGVEVIDAFGSTEGGIAVNRDSEPREGAMGVAGPTIKIVNDDGEDCPRATFDGDGHLLNADDCVGEIVNTAGAGPFEGYYNNPEATQRTTRKGWYWSGDLGYLDDDGYLYFAGRNADWLRVDGENFSAAPIEAALAKHPDVVLASVYGVPDEQSGDQVMAALLLQDGAQFEPARFAWWLDSHDSIGPKWRPRYVRVVGELPTTGTNKVVKRTLVHEKFRRDRLGPDQLFVRLRGEDTYRPFLAEDEASLHERFVRAGRERFWDL
ncbi:MAG: AMP-binding protein [Actinobacteria bacterium]|nr:AMP-binding protein [Actinomycetota bacterium]